MGSASYLHSQEALYILQNHLELREKERDELNVVKRHLLQEIKLPESSYVVRLVNDELRKRREEIAHIEADLAERKNLAKLNLQAKAIDP